eukprot:TRINITY_DN1083_c0_g1_i9.p1 TRINITY_DN1083_c0_g1~~TRINITY_DN1083_c0_g1_i9.p1  ORF type:complete len:301 (+),score=37.75 TRINITY_DN1083_c0_g1_i9:394-1296(+)
MEAVPSDAELTAAVADILGSENLESLTVRTMMGILGRRFEGVDLTQRKKFIKHEVDRLMHLRVPAPADEGEVGDEGGGYEQQQQHLQVAYPPAGVPATYETNGAPAIEEKKRAKRARPSGKANGGASGGRAAGNPAKPRKLSGLKKAVVLAEPLAHFLGEVVLPRSQIAKRVTTYVKLHNLQDEADKRHILADEALRRCSRSTGSASSRLTSSSPTWYTALTSVRQSCRRWRSSATWLRWRRRRGKLQRPRRAPTRIVRPSRLLWRRSPSGSVRQRRLRLRLGGPSPPRAWRHPNVSTSI